MRLTRWVDIPVLEIIPIETPTPGEATGVFTIHGFGRFCSASQAEGTSSTIGDEKKSNPAPTRDGKRFVAHHGAGLDAFPAYSAHMGVEPRRREARVGSCRAADRRQGRWRRPGGLSGSASCTAVRSAPALV